MMAKRDWKAQQQEYKLAFEQTGITIKAWCDQNQTITTRRVDICRC